MAESSSIKPSRSDTYKPVPDANQQGVIFIDQGADSVYQGDSRGEEPGVDSLVSKVRVADTCIFLLTITARL